MTRSTTIRLTAAAVALAGLTLGACGGDDAGDTGASGTRTIEIEMRDIAFSPAQVDVRAGETVRFVFTNEGKLKHDAFIGDETAQTEHEMQMQDQSGMTSMGHDGTSTGAGEGITVDPGDTGELTRTFQEGKQLIIGCHQPGHYDAGMHIAVNVG